jgi:hypothetical protein
MLSDSSLARPANPSEMSPRMDTYAVKSRAVCCRPSASENILRGRGAKVSVPKLDVQQMIKTAEINSRLLEGLPVIRLPKFVPAGGGLSIWWMGDDRITFHAISSDTAGAYAFWVDEPPGQVGPPNP